MTIRFVPLRLHAAADFLVGASFFGVPVACDFPPGVTYLSWAVAALHLTMTLLTDYPGGVVKLIPLRVHLLVELFLGPVLVAAPWVFAFSSHRAAATLFAAWGVISFLTYFVTNRTLPARAAAAAASR